MQANIRSFNETGELEKDKDNSCSTSTNSITSFKAKKNNFLKILGIITSALNVILIILTIIMYFVNGSSRNNQLIIFQYTNEYLPFQTHQVSLIFMLLILLSFYTTITYLLLTKRDKEFSKIYRTPRYSKLFPIINIFLLTVFLTGIIEEKTRLTSIIVLISLLATTLGILTLYRDIKTKKKLSPFALLSLSISMSVILAFNTYVILYDLSDIITLNHGEKYVSNEFKRFVAISFNVIYMCIAVVLLSIHKDIIFSACLILVEIGYVSNHVKLSAEEIITGCSIMAFILVSIVITIMRYKKAVFGYENEVWVKDLENDWRENSSNCIRENN